MKRKIPGQQALNLFERHDPRNCSEESAVVDIGGGKSFCEAWDRWTNCREVGHCVFDRFGEV